MTKNMDVMQIHQFSLLPTTIDTHTYTHTPLYLFCFFHNPEIFIPNIVMFQFISMPSMSKTKLVMEFDSW